MKKLILILPMLLFLTMSVLAEDFSLRGDFKVNVNPGYNYTGSFSSWHSDGREPSQRFNSNRFPEVNKLSNGIKPQGKGSLSIAVNNLGERIIFNLLLDEIEILSDENNQIKILTKATGNIWMKGNKPQRISFSLVYIYNRNLGTIDIIIDDFPVVQNMQVNNLKS